MEKGNTVEIWKPVAGYEGFYEVSSKGRIRSKDRTTKNGGGEFVKKGRVLKLVDNGNGYLRVELKVNNTSAKKYVHRIVAETFIENPANKPFINHLDNNPYNNAIENLEWCTPKENFLWMAMQGRNKRTDKWLKHLHEAQKETYMAVVGENIATGEKIFFEKLNEVKSMGFQPSCVCNCCKGKRKQHKGYRWAYE